MSRPPLLLGVELADAGAHPAAWRLPAASPGRLFDPARWTELARTAARGGLDLAFLPDAFGLQGEPGGVRGRLDALLTACRLAPVTTGIGLVPTVTTTHTEPFHVGKAVQTLDWVSRGRAGWQIGVSRTPAEAALFGRKAAEADDELWAEADDVAEVVARLEDSWEDDAEIRDVSSGRYIDRGKVHPVRFAGPRFSVEGASITPRSPQGRPPVVVRADSPAALRVAAARADVVRIDAPDREVAARRRDRIRDAVRDAGRTADEVAVVVDVVAWIGEDGPGRREALDREWSWTPGTAVHAGSAEGLAELLESWAPVVDGVVVRPAVLPTDLIALTDDVVPLLRERGLRPAGAPGPTLRDTLGLPRPASRYATAETAR
jgi:alkanesulfonate monooxygenase SsuD/methylene tetrahydromethanopterin reductase-like flavin-dependent oxidoreductase (luciferase family)